MGEIVITGLNKTYPNGVAALQDFDLAVADGEFLVLVGPRDAASPRCCAASPGWSGPPREPSPWAVEW